VEENARNGTGRSKRLNLSKKGEDKQGISMKERSKSHRNKEGNPSNEANDGRRNAKRRGKRQIHGRGKRDLPCGRRGL
jgi:hypothetical protein